jgi:hypothetical protein
MRAKTYLLYISGLKNSLEDSREFEGFPMFSHYRKGKNLRVGEY